VRNVEKQSFCKVLFHFLMPAEKEKGEAMKLFSHEKHSMTGKKVPGHLVQALSAKALERPPCLFFHLGGHFLFFC